MNLIAQFILLPQYNYSMANAPSVAVVHITLVAVAPAKDSRKTCSC